VSPSITIDTYLPPGWADEELLADIRRTFSSTPKVLRPKWLYDDAGSALFDDITRLAAYYPTEAERSILAEHSDEIASLTSADTIIELGSGTSDKTRLVLDAFWATGQLTRFCPLDVSEETLVRAARMLAERYPGLEIHGVVGDFNEHLHHLPEGTKRMVAFLGSTLGNFYAEERRAFLGALGDVLSEGEFLLLGIDLAKDAQRIVDAYNDDSGTTEQFIENVIAVINRKLDADIPIEQLDYVPLWDAREERLDMRLRASMPIDARIGALDLDIEFTEGEELRVEVSTKFRPDRIAEELAEAGFSIDRFWTSAPSEDGRLLDHDFGLILAVRG